MQTLPLSHLSMDELVQTKLYPQLDYFFDKLSQEMDGLRIDGVEALHSKDKFLPGKVALGLGHVLLNTPADDPRLDAYLARYRDVAELTAPLENQSWGIYYYLLMLVRLQQAGLLERAIRPETLDLLRERLDWRSFVDFADLRLINLPTNYYGVAFSVARLRDMLGWEHEDFASRLLDKMLEHYERYSGEFGFSDETEGEGRFDRYSVLLIAEVCQRYVQTGMTVPERLHALLRRSVDLVLGMANADGHGFGYGRSIGPYGDSAVVEILSVAAYLKVLNETEQVQAYAYSVCCLAKYLSFWFNPAIQSVDMWGGGRRTDGYRAKHRILGENFSLIHQYISSSALWNACGFQGRTPQLGLQQWLHETRPAFALTWFSRGRYDRALAVRRDADLVICLPLIDGGIDQHDNSPYYPIPFAEGVVAGIADSGPAHPQLLPRFELEDGSVLLPTSFIRGVQHETHEDRAALSYRLDELNRVGKRKPEPDDRIQVHTRYEFEAGRITRIDTIRSTEPLRLRELSLEFLSFSSDVRLSDNAVEFGEGRVTRFEVEGLGLQHALPTTPDDDFKSPSGPMRSWLRYRLVDHFLDAPLTLRWTLHYR